jgi:hypothetical protein
MRRTILTGTLLVLATLAAGAEPSAARPPDKLALAFRPPTEFAGDFGPYRSPLKFDDGRDVTNAADWARRREEILRYWHGALGPWPPPIDKPKLDVLSIERRDGYARQHVRLETAPGRTTDDAYLLVPDGAGPFPAVLVVYYDGLTGIGEGKSPNRDFAARLARRGFVALSIGSPPASYYPDKETCRLQPLSYHAYVAANAGTALAQMPNVDPRRVGVVGHSYGGKWAMFASCLSERFACGVWCDGGIVFDEKRPNVNYWEPWYLGFERGRERARGVPKADNPRTGPYRRLVEEARDLHELHALMAPRPFLVSGGSEDQPERWRALNHAVAVNKVLGYENRVAMTNRQAHAPTEESNGQIDLFFEYVLKPPAGGMR